MVTSVIRAPVPAIWRPQYLLSQAIESFLGVRSPKTEIRLRLPGQRRWSAYDSAIGSLSSSASASNPSGSGRSPGSEMLPMYDEATTGSSESVDRWEQYSLRGCFAHFRSL